MKTFKIYRYRFNPTMEEFMPNLFVSSEQVEDEINSLMSRKTKIFEENFNRFKFSYRNKEHSILKMYNNDSLIIFKIANKKKRIIERDFEKQQEVDEPSVIVIIDNADGVQRIAIEENMSAFSDVNVVATILQNSFCKGLKEHKLQVNLQSVYDENEFWDYVRDNKNSIQLVRFQFDYPNLPGSLTNKIRDVIKGVSRDTLSKRSAFELSSDVGLDLDENNPDLQSLNKVSSELGSPTTLKIKGFKKTIKTGRTTKTIHIEELEVVDGNIEEIRRIINE